MLGVVLGCGSKGVLGRGDRGVGPLTPHIPVPVTAASQALARQTSNCFFVGDALVTKLVTMVCAPGVWHDEANNCIRISLTQITAVAPADPKGKCAVPKSSVGGALTLAEGSARRYCATRGGGGTTNRPQISGPPPRPMSGTRAPATVAQLPPPVHWGVAPGDRRPCGGAIRAQCIFRLALPGVHTCSPFEEGILHAGMGPTRWVGG